MKLIFVYGMPAAGKLTVARDLSRITGFRLFHNHLVVDLLLSTFDFGSNPFVELREEIWLSVFRHACRSGLAGLIFTYAPEETVRETFVDDAVRVMRDEGGEVEFVELTCPIDELKLRLDSADRKEFGKLTSVELFDRLRTDGALYGCRMPKPKITIDTSRHEPADAAAMIAKALHLA